MQAIDALYQAVGWSKPGGIRKRDHFLVATSGRKIVGSLMYWEYPSDSIMADSWVERFGQSSRLEICEIAVDPEHQRTGIGRLLVVRAAEVAVTRGLDYISAWPSPRGGGGKVSARLSFFKACGMDEAELDPGVISVVGKATAVLERTRTCKDQPTVTDESHHSIG
jgi:GNAT superfamily N-acetyltransferase